MDFDTGVDDAIALLCALLCQDQIEILSVSAVAGNVSLEHTAQNTLDIVRGMGEAQIKVVKGAEKPLVRDLHCAVSHGETGLGDVVIPHVQPDFYEKSVEDAIYESAEKAEGELIYVGVGPQTNLALALKKHPRLSGKIRRIVLMGGSLIGGNMTQASEFNAYVDPEALHAVFQTGVPITMVGLDVTLKTELPDWVLKRLQNMNNLHAKLAAQILDFIQRRSCQYGFDKANLHDALAFCAVVCPDVLQTKPYYVDVETKGELTRGMTVADFRNVCTEKTPNADCAVEVDIDRFWNWLVTVFSKEELRFEKKVLKKCNISGTPLRPVKRRGVLCPCAFFLTAF